MNKTFSIRVCHVFNFCRSIPSSCDLWSMYVDIQTGSFDQWETLIPTFNYSPKIPFFEITVPTKETVRMGYIAERLLAVNHPVLFTGLTGKRAILLYSLYRQRIAVRFYSTGFLKGLCVLIIIHLTIQCHMHINM